MDTNLHLELYKEYCSTEIKAGNEDSILNFSDWRELNKEALL